MKTMTTAEFGKATLAALEEPVEIRRYTKVIGTYYPAGYDPADLPKVVDAAVIGMFPVEDPASKKITELEDEVKRLKKELAARPPLLVGREDVTAIGKTAYDRIPTTKRTDDPFIGLSKQDREFFDRKLGKKK